MKVFVFDNPPKLMSIGILTYFPFVSFITIISNSLMDFSEYLGSTNSELIATFQKTFLTTDFKV